MKIGNKHANAGAFFVLVLSGYYTGKHLLKTINDVENFIDLVLIYGKVDIEIIPLYDIGMSYMFSGKKLWGDRYTRYSIKIIVKPEDPADII